MPDNLLVIWRRKKGRDLFRPYELAVLEAVLAELDPEARSLIEQQIAATEQIHRLYDDTEVDLYPTRRRDVQHDPTIALPNRSLELKLATVRLRGPNETGKVDLYAVRGHLFQLAFRPSPKKLGDRSAIQVTTVTIHVDPMLPDEGESVQVRLQRLDPALRSALEARWDAGSAEADGLLGPEEIYTIDLEDGTCLVLAQLEDATMLVATVDPPRSGVRRFDTDGDLVGEHPSLTEALAAARTAN